MTVQSLPLIESANLLLRLQEEADAPAMVRYFEENREHLAPYEPPKPDEFYTEDFWRQRALQAQREFEAGASMRLVLFKKAEPGVAIGTVSFTAILRGPAQYCNMGYGLAAGEQGKGHFREILPLAIAHVFEELKLHRIQANYMPTNERSGKLLRALGFVVEGYARDYLFINGAWRDHVLTSLTNPKLPRPER